MAEYDPASEHTGYEHIIHDFEDNSDGQYNIQAEEEEEDDDYDPSSFTFDASAGDVQSTELMQTDEADAPVVQVEQPVQPKTIGGFIVDDDDDEDEEEEQGIIAAAPPPSQLNGEAGSHSGLGAVAIAEAAEKSAAQDVPIASEPQEDTAAVSFAQQTAPEGVRLNGSTSPPAPAPAPASVPFMSNTESASTPVPSASAPLLHASTPVASIQSPAPPPTASGPDQGKQHTILPPTDSASALQSATATPQPPSTTTTNTVAAAPSAAQSNGPVPAAPTSQRLPHDKVGHLEDRIKEDPKGDLEAWRGLIAHYREKGQLDNARSVYSRFFEVFPSASSMWVEYAQMELEHDNYPNVEQIFGLSLLQLPNVDMWTVYLDYLRRIHPLTNDVDGSKRGIINSAFDLLLERVGIDPDSGKLWRDYVDFIKSGPGVIGNKGWQDLQKEDLLRKAYQHAIKLPHSELTKLWKEYDNFEHGLNKATGRKNLQEQSPHYMTARTAKTQMDQKLVGLDRRSLPKLPPIFGCAGDDEFAAQVQRWRGWIAWEKEDPLVFKEENIAVYRNRVIYAYKQATMELRYYPEIWFEAASWCFEQGVEDMITQGQEFLQQGIDANPESVLLALMKADRVESKLEAGNSDEVAIRNGQTLDPIFENVLKPLYALHKKTQERINKEVARIQEYYNSLTPEEDPEPELEEADDNASNASSTVKPQTRAQKMQSQIDAYKSAMGERQEELKRTISYIWVAKMRAFRRIQGQGLPGKERKGFRGVFAEARPRGQLTSAVYIASAQMEWYCYKDPSASKIFERGQKLFPLDEVFTVEYIKHLVNTHDLVNARATFETTITKINGSEKLSLEEKRRKCRGLLVYMHEFESWYGDLDKIHKLEKRMAEMYPEEPQIAQFAARNALPSFDAMRVQLIISPTQMTPKTTAQAMRPEQPLPSIEEPRSPPEANHIRLGPNGPYVASPKRSLEDSDNEGPQRNKFMRGESPLKGAAGRRIQTQTGSGTINMPTAGGSGFMTKNYVAPTAAPAAPPAPAPLPREITYLLSILPAASHYGVTRFDPHAMVEFLRGVNLAAAKDPRTNLPMN